MSEIAGGRGENHVKRHKFRWRTGGQNERRPLWEGKLNPNPLLLEGCNPNEKDYYGLGLSALPPGGPPKGLGEALGTGGAQVRRRCTSPPGSTTATWWSLRSSLQVPGAPDLFHPFLPHSRVETIAEG